MYKLSISVLYVCIHIVLVLFLEKSDRLFDTESGSAEHDLKDEFSELSPEVLEWVLNLIIF